MDITLITSLYRAEKFLPDYIRHVHQVAAALHAAGISLEVCVIANDVTIAERGIVENFAAQAKYFSVRVTAVPRESLYASWNRGVDMATGQVIGIWNVDDIRTAEALQEGYQRITRGECRVIDFPLTERDLRGPHPQDKEIICRENRYAPLPLNQARLGPFFMFDRTLYDVVGPFDGVFKIVGDFEWQVRAIQLTPCCEGKKNAGVFHVHGGNLSRKAGLLVDYAAAAEDNMVYLLHEAYDHLRFTDPEVMQKTAQRWDDLHIPADVANKLWGEDVRQRFTRWQRSQQVIHYFEPLRPLAKTLINRLGLRRILARFGVVLDESFAPSHQVRK